MVSLPMNAIVAALPRPSLALCAASPELRLETGRSPHGYRVGAYTITTHPSSSVLSQELRAMEAAEQPMTAVVVEGNQHHHPTARSAVHCLEEHVGWWLQRNGEAISLQLKDCSLGNLDEEATANLPSLIRKLDITRCTVAGECQWLAACTELVALSCSNSLLQSSEWIAASRSTLTALTISDVDEKIDLTVVGELQQLKSLRLISVAVENIDWMSGCSSLEKLHISECKHITDFALIGSLQKLKNLDLSGSPLDNIDWMVPCSNLEKLNINGCVAIQDFNPLRHLQGLTSLSMSATHLDTMEWIESCSYLARLNISGCECITDFKYIGLLHSLKELDMSATRVRKIKWIKDCTLLEKLNISECQDIKHFKYIAHLKRMKDLDMSATHIRELAWIDGCKAIEILNISGCQDIDHHFKYIDCLHNLKYLNISATEVDSIEWIDKCSRSLKALDISDCERLLCLSPVSRIDTLKELRLSGTTGKHKHLMIMQCIRECRSLSLEKLSIRGFHGITDLSAIGRFCNLKELDISDTDVHVINWMGNCSHLEWLNISSCSRLKEMNILGRLQNLKDIDVSNTNVDSIECLDACKSLKRVNIAGCSFITAFSRSRWKLATSDSAYQMMA